MESFLATLKEQVKCSLCNETLNEPKLLPCFHVFCTTCIKGHLQLNDEQDLNIFHCPECNSETRLRQDVNEVDDLQDSPVHSKIVKVLEFIESQKICSVSSSHPEALWHCVDCNESLCEECLRCHSKFTKNHRVILLSDLKEEDVKVMLQKERTCRVHDDHIVESHCQDCDMLICVLCRKSHHNKHNTVTLQEFVATEKQSLSNILEDIDIIVDDEEARKQQDKISLRIESEGEIAEQQVKELTEKLIKTLRNNEQQLLNKIRISITKARRNLRIIHHITQAREYIKQFIENGTASEMMENRQGESSQNFTYDPIDQSDPKVQFTPNEKLCEQVEFGLGQVRTFLKKADPNMTCARIESSEVEAMQKAQLIINLKTSKNEDADESLENVEIKFSPEHCVKLEEKEMTGNSTITVDFIPRVPGPLSAEIALYGSPISNSPVVLSVKPQIMDEHTGDSKLKDALNTGSKTFDGIAVNKINSKIAIADSKLNCIRVYNMEGDLLLTYGSENGKQLKQPDGVAFLNETDLVIADRGNNRICLVNTNTWKMVTSFGVRGSGDGNLKNPYGVHVDDESNIIVCDHDNNRVQVFSRDGAYLYQFSVPRPYDVVKHDGLFYVSDYEHSVVRVIKMDGNQSATTVTTIGGKNYTEGRTKNPCGLAIDKDGNLLVCNGCDLLDKFNLDGHYVGQSRKLSLNANYIAILHDGQIIFTSYGKGVGFLKLDK